ncbi:MAG: hypothetical protein ACI8X5_000835 [Planctomycetota bacterium]|jgi:hypothetical protein
MTRNGILVRNWTLGLVALLLVASAIKVLLTLESHQGQGGLFPNALSGVAVPSERDLHGHMGSSERTATGIIRQERNQLATSTGAEMLIDEHPLVAQTASIGVTVVWARSGELAVNHRVYLTDTSTRHPRSGITDDHGRVRFCQLRAGAKVVLSERGGWCAVDLQASEIREVEVVIPEGLRVPVRVESKDGQPIGGATVLLGYRSDGAGGGATAATTDQDGRCLLMDVSPGRILWVLADGFEPSYRHKVTDTEIRIVMGNPGFDFSGRVVDEESGQGVVGAWVQVEGYDSPTTLTREDGTAITFGPAPPPTCRTDEDGLFSVPVSDRGGLSIGVIAEGYAVQSAPIEPRAGQTGWVEISIRRAAPLYGYVADEHGASVGDVLLRLVGEPGTNEIVAFSERDGSFQIPGVPPGKFTLKGTSAGGFVGTMKVNLEAGRKRGVQQLVVSSQEAIRIQVTSLAGTPIPGCQLVRIVEPLAAPAFLTLRKIGKTDSAGECRVKREDLGASAYVGIVLADIKPSFPFRTVPLEPGSQVVRLEIPANPIGSALQFNNNGKSDSGARSSPTLSVFLKRNEEGLWLGRVIPAGQSASFEGLEAGLYHALVAIGNDYYDLGTFTLGSGEKLEVPLTAAHCLELPPASIFQ